MPLSKTNQIAKRTLDFTGAALGLALTFWLIGLAWIIATFDTQKNGFFMQKRVGKNGRLFKVIKIRTMLDIKSIKTCVTTDKDPRITKIGRFLRKTKIDELPQLINVLLGQMSFVGPRPDISGYADQLKGDDKIILSLRPGITGPATLYYRHEEILLAQQDDPEKYNKEVIFPHKVQINKQYIAEYSLYKDIIYIIQTLKG